MSIPGTDLKIDMINTPEKLRRLEEFARSFDHEVCETNHPLMAFRWGDRPWHGYMQIYNGPVLFTAWHTNPDVCSARDFLENMKQVIGWIKIQHGGGLMSVPVGSKTFTPEVMQKLGHIRCNSELYKTLA